MIMGFPRLQDRVEFVVYTEPDRDPHKCEYAEFYAHDRSMGGTGQWERLTQCMTEPACVVCGHMFCRRHAKEILCDCGALPDKEISRAALIQAEAMLHTWSDAR